MSERSFRPSSSAASSCWPSCPRCSLRYWSGGPWPTGRAVSIRRGGGVNLATVTSDPMSPKHESRWPGACRRAARLGALPRPAGRLLTELAIRKGCGCGQGTTNLNPAPALHRIGGRARRRDRSQANPRARRARSRRPLPPAGLSVAVGLPPLVVGAEERRVPGEREADRAPRVSDHLVGRGRLRHAWLAATPAEPSSSEPPPAPDDLLLTSSCLACLTTNDSYVPCVTQV